jgi:hypothetical protein
MTGARNLVERFFNKIKQCRRVATRYDKLAANYLAFIQLASIRLWLRVNESAPLYEYTAWSCCGQPIDSVYLSTDTNCRD